jgi:hypothetical protein
MRAALRDTDFVTLVRERVVSRAVVTTKLAIAPLVAGERPLEHRLEIAIEGPRLASKGERDPELTLLVGAHVCLRRMSDEACLYRRRWLYRAIEGSYFQVAANDAARLRSDLPVAAERLSDKIVLDFSVAMQR